LNLLIISLFIAVPMNANGMQIGDVAGLGALNYQFTTKVF
jgi:hypothetical protein